MANEPLALATETAAPSEDEYEAFYAALSGSARGRAFLAEHGRRQRLADTDMLLGALGRLATQVVAPAPLQIDPIREELGVLVEAIRSVQAEIDASNLALQVAKLTSMVEVLKTRIEGIAATPGTAEPAAEMPAAMPAPMTEPAAFMPPGEAAPPAPQASSIPEVSWFESLPHAEDESAHDATAAEAAAEPPPTLAIAFVAEVAEREAIVAAAKEPEPPPEAKVIKAGTMPPPQPYAGEDFSAATAVKTVPKTDLLDSIMALSDDERTALFT
jgi:hypothetical protein